MLDTGLVGILWSGTTPVGTLGDTVPAGVELTGNLEGARLVGTLEDIIPGVFELVGNLEGTVLVSAEWRGTLEGAVLVVTELVGTATPLEQAVDSAPLAEEEKVPVDGADTAGPGKRLARGVERARGWKEAVGETGPWDDVMLETLSAGEKTKEETQTHRRAGIRELEKGPSAPAHTISLASRLPNFLPSPFGHCS